MIDSWCRASWMRYCGSRTVRMISVFSTTSLSCSDPRWHRHLTISPDEPVFLCLIKLERILAGRRNCMSNVLSFQQMQCATLAVFVWCQANWWQRLGNARTWEFREMCYFWLKVEKLGTEQSIWVSVPLFCSYFLIVHMLRRGKKEGEVLHNDSDGWAERTACGFGVCCHVVDLVALFFHTARTVLTAVYEHRVSYYVEAVMCSVWHWWLAFCAQPSLVH